jgi:hypothetical protein
MSKESNSGYDFKKSEYVRYHMDSRQEAKEFLDKKAKKVRLIVDSYPDIFH